MAVEITRQAVKAIPSVVGTANVGSLVGVLHLIRVNLPHRALQMTSLPPIAELLSHDPESRFQQNLALVGTSSTLSHLRYYPDEVLVREFSQMEKNRAFEQRRWVGLETLQIASLDPGPSLDLIIRAAILGSPSRRLRLFDIQRAIRIWSGASLTTVIRPNIFSVGRVYLDLMRRCLSHFPASALIC
ncbi:hypothetical protein JB92DRAFT_2827453 [Gautieria morchelliformis]|nr:hypothetical protein JB92DRAFT_2827453 [Gautieria morchelliformis]